LIELWLARSMQQPLSLFLSYIGAQQHWMSGDALQILIRHFPRWKRIHFELGLRNSISPPLHAEIEAGAAPWLERIKLRVTAAHLLDRTPIFRIFSAAPRLERFKWHGALFERIDCNPPWRQLTHVDISGFELLSSCMSVLNSSPRLVKCSFRTIFAPQPIDIRDAPRVLSDLRVFKLEATGGSTMDVGPVLEDITFPNLRTFDLIFHSREPWPQSKFASFLSRSSCQLEELRLNVALLEDDLIECLRMTTNTLRTISIDDIYQMGCVSERVCALLIPTTSQPQCLCPNLRRIIFHDCISAPDGRLADLVESRWKIDPKRSTVARLERGEFTIPEDNVIDFERLQELSDLGLDIFAEQGWRGTVGIGAPLDHRDSEDDSYDEADLYD
jgi:hypothetical protein